MPGCASKADLYGSALTLLQPLQIILAVIVMVVLIVVVVWASRSKPSQLLLAFEIFLPIMRLLLQASEIVHGMGLDAIRGLQAFLVLRLELVVIFFFLVLATHGELREVP